MNPHAWVWMRSPTSLFVGSICVRCGYRAYGWGGKIGPCIAEPA